MEGSGSPSNCEPPPVKKIRGSVNYFILLYDESLSVAGVYCDPLKYASIPVSDGLVDGLMDGLVV